MAHLRNIKQEQMKPIKGKWHRIFQALLVFLIYLDVCNVL